MEKNTVVKEVRENFVGFYVSGKMYEAIVKAADADRRSVSDFMRLHLERTLPVKK